MPWNLLDREVFVVGNAGHIDDPAQFGLALAELVRSNPHDWLVVFNGDLAPAELNFMEGARHLNLMIEPLTRLEGGKVILVPGDREWEGGSRQGLASLLLLERFINEQPYAHKIVYGPKNGCPGPKLVEVDESLNLILLNTQWWNQEFNRPTPESAQCSYADPAVVFEEIESLIDDSANKNVLVLGHHPLSSHGPYGGYFPLTNWIFPFPGISFFNTAYKQNVGGALEISNARLTEFREDLDNLFAPYFSLIYASGHEFSMEAFAVNENLMLNSGSAGRGGFVRKKNQHLLASREPGLLSICYIRTGQVNLNRYQWKDSSFQIAETKMAFQAPCLAPANDIPVNRRLIPCLEESPEMNYGSLTYPDSIEIAANPYYAIPRGKQFWLGKHYRDSWTSQIKAPVLKPDNYRGGLTPLEEGGGRQTKSLKFAAQDGLEYVFRSVDKDPSKALQHDLRSTIISLLVRDQTTTQQPYGALVIPTLLKPLGVLHATPRLYVMPNSEVLGPFRSSFGGMLGMMEERPVDPKNGISFENADDIKRTNSLFRTMYRNHKSNIKLDEFVTARIFDLWVGDWGKHEDNWKWAGYRENGEMTYRPIPRDRDHVFALYDGFLPRLIDREWAKPSGEDFSYRIKGLRSLMWQARHLDRFLASEATRDDWLQAATIIKDRINDDTIEEAIAQLPEPIRSRDGNGIGLKLQQRLADLDDYVRKYYAMLAREVDVVGTNEEERFEVNRNEDGSVTVRMFEVGKRPRLRFERRFYPFETREIRLFGLNGDDQFDLRGQAGKSIKIRIVPGAGLDSVIDASHAAGGKKTLLYEDLSSVDKVTPGKELRYVRNADESAYQYQRTAFHYNTYFPLVYMTFSSDYGLALRAGVSFTNHAYGKSDFSSKHSLSALVSTVGNVRIRARSTWRQRISTLDVIAGIEAQSRRRYRYFFGVGNETKYDQSQLTDDFYTSQFASGQVYLGLEKTFLQRSYLNMSLSYELSSGNTLDQTIFTDGPTILGVEELGIASFFGALEIDLRNRKDLPERGARVYSENKLAKPLEEEYGSYLTGFLTTEYFATARPVTIGVKAGVMYSAGEAPYFDLPTLGQNAFLRGYRRNRFAGKNAVFINSEVRVQLKDHLTSLIPYKFGLKGFVDLGKVYLPGEQSTLLHKGYGGGFYLVPLKERFTINVTAAFSAEEKGLILFGLGKSF